MSNWKKCLKNFCIQKEAAQNNSMTPAGMISTKLICRIWLRAGDIGTENLGLKLDVVDVIVMNWGWYKFKFYTKPALLRLWQAEAEREGQLSNFLFRIPWIIPIVVRPCLSYVSLAIMLDSCSK